MKRGRRNSDKEETAVKSPFHIVQFSGDQSAHLHHPFCKQKISRPYRTRDPWFHLILCICHHIHLIGYREKSSIPWLCIGSTRKDLLLVQSAGLRNALQHLIRIRLHSPDSLCRIRTAYSFLHCLKLSLTLPSIFHSVNRKSIIPHGVPWNVCHLSFSPRFPDHVRQRLPEADKRLPANSSFWYIPRFHLNDG